MNRITSLVVALALGVQLEAPLHAATGVAGGSLNAEAPRSAAAEMEKRKRSNQEEACLDRAYGAYSACMDYWFNQGGDNAPYQDQCLKIGRNVYDDCMRDRGDYWS